MAKHGLILAPFSAEVKRLMGESTKEHLKELLKSFDTAMLITHDGDKEHARPMAIAGVEGANTIWFVTSAVSPKIEELTRDSRVAATFQSSTQFVALSGKGEVVNDRAKIEELWQASWKVWFPNGKEDPEVRLIRVAVTDAEFWDNAGAKGIRYAFEAVKALVTGEKPESIEGASHGRVKDNGARPRLS